MLCNSKYDSINIMSFDIISYPTVHEFLKSICDVIRSQDSGMIKDL